MSNIICLIGNIGQDSETRYMSNGTAILTFSVANSTGFGDKKKDTWYRVSMFGKQAEGKLKDFLLKGQTVFVSGEFSPNEYQSKDGTTKVSYEIRANFVDLVGPRKEPQQTESGLVSGKISVINKHHEQKSNGYAPDDDYSDSIPF